MRNKKILWLTLSLLLLSCAPEEASSFSSFLESSNSSFSSAAEEESFVSVTSSESVTSRSSEMSSESSSESSSSSEESSLSSDEPSVSSLVDTRDWEWLTTLLNEAKAQQKSVIAGDILVAETAEEVYATNQYVTPTMYHDLEAAIVAGDALSLSSSEQEFLSAINALESALMAFAPQQGTKEKEKTFQDVVDDLRSGRNQNVVTYARDKEQHAILWVNGIVPPKRGDEDAFKTEKWGDYVYEYAEEGQGEGWTDVNKIDQSGKERLLCYAAASANQLHWFFRVNQDKITQYLTKLDDATKKEVIASFMNSYHGQQDSYIYHTAFRSLFAPLSYAYHTDIVNDYVINGYPLPSQSQAEGFQNADQSLEKPDAGKYAGLFYSVFGGKKLTSRMGAGDYATFQSRLLGALKDGDSVALVHSTGSLATHIVTVWGAEVDDKGNLIAVYVTDSDNTDESYSYQALERKLIKNSAGAVKLSINVANPNHGATIMELVTLEDGATHWNDFLSQ